MSKYTIEKISSFFKITISDDNLIKIWYNTEKVKITKVTYQSKRKKYIDSHGGYSFHRLEGVAVVIVVAELVNCSYYLDEVTFIIELI